LWGSITVASAHAHDQPLRCGTAMRGAASTAPRRGRAGCRMAAPATRRAASGAPSEWERPRGRAADAGPPAQQLQLATPVGCHHRPMVGRCRTHGSHAPAGVVGLRKTGRRGRRGEGRGAAPILFWGPLQPPECRPRSRFVPQTCTQTQQRRYYAATTHACPPALYTRHPASLQRLAVEARSSRAPRPPHTKHRARQCCVKGRKEDAEVQAQHHGLVARGAG
jgi:hypothetical protein